MYSIVHVNVATAFRKLLLPQRAQGGGAPLAGRVQRALWALEASALHNLEDFDPQGIANTLHTMAKARYATWISSSLRPSSGGRRRRRSWSSSSAACRT